MQEHSSPSELPTRAGRGDVGRSVSCSRFARRNSSDLWSLGGTGAGSEEIRTIRTGGWGSLKGESTSRRGVAGLASPIQRDLAGRTVWVCWIRIPGWTLVRIAFRSLHFECLPGIATGQGCLGRGPVERRALSASIGMTHDRGRVQHRPRR